MTTTRFRDSERRDLVTRCTTILDGVQRMARHEPGYDLKDVLSHLASMDGRYDVPGLSFALRVWCDMLIDATPGARHGQRVKVAFLTASGDVEAEAADPAHQWAADLVTARMGHDEMGFYRLTADLPADLAGRGEYIFRLVEMVAYALDAYAYPDQASRVKPGLYSAARVMS